MRRKSSIIVIILIVVLAGASLFYLFYPKVRGGQALATVNGENITVSDFNHEIGNVDEQARGMIRENPAEFLEGMIVKTLILQEAEKQGILPARENKGQEGSISSEDAVIKEFIEKKFSFVPAVSQEEIAEFYEMYKDRMGGESLEQTAPMIEQIIGQVKQQKQLEQFVGDLRNSARIDIDEKRLKKLAVKPLDSNTEKDFLNALKSGKPVMVDFGSNSCSPCRQMRPIVHEVKKEYSGKAEVLVIDVHKHNSLASKQKIQLIPTLIFFDSTGKEVHRHQGFMSKKLILEQFKKMGIS